MTRQPRRLIIANSSPVTAPSAMAWYSRIGHALPAWACCSLIEAISASMKRADFGKKRFHVAYLRTQGALHPHDVVWVVFWKHCTFEGVILAHGGDLVIG